MKITLLQFDVAWQDEAENLRRMQSLMECAPQSDLYLLPEMCTSGFCMTPHECAALPDGPATEWMRRQAALRDAAVVGGLMLRTPQGEHVNRLLFVEPDGTISHYDKHHLFTYSGETDCFAAGDRRVVVNFRGVRFLLSICYDLRFPVWLRNRRDYDVLLCAASWPQSRRHVWSTLLAARAIENQCYVAGVNRVGDDPFGSYLGDSLVVSPYGKPVAAAQEGATQCVTAELDMERLAAFRAKFPVLGDADDFGLVPRPVPQR